MNAATPPARCASRIACSVNVVFPIDRLRELSADGAVGSMASVHYSFMGAFPPDAAKPHAQHLAGLLKADKVDAVLLVPV